MFAKAVRQSSPCFVYVIVGLPTQSAGYAIDDIWEMHVKRSVILKHRFGPEILNRLEIKGQVLHRVREHLKVYGWLSDDDMTVQVRLTNNSQSRIHYLQHEGVFKLKMKSIVIKRKPTEFGSGKITHLSILVANY